MLACARNRARARDCGGCGCSHAHMCICAMTCICARCASVCMWYAAGRTHVWYVHVVHRMCMWGDAAGRVNQADACRAVDKRHDPSWVSRGRWATHRLCHRKTSDASQKGVQAACTSLSRALREKKRPRLHTTSDGHSEEMGSTHAYDPTFTLGVLPSRRRSLGRQRRNYVNKSSNDSPTCCSNSLAIYKFRTCSLFAMASFVARWPPRVAWTVD